jgi:hypothetical protein
MTEQAEEETHADGSQRKDRAALLGYAAAVLVATAGWFWLLGWIALQLMSLAFT